MALSSPPQCVVDPQVRPVRIEELDAYLVAAIEMFIGEVGVDPRVGTAAVATDVASPA